MLDGLHLDKMVHKSPKNGIGQSGANRTKHANKSNKSNTVHPNAVIITPTLHADKGRISCGRDKMNAISSNSQAFLINRDQG